MRPPCSSSSAHFSCWRFARACSRPSPVGKPFNMETVLAGTPPILLENRHTGERLTLKRVRRGDEVWLELKGSLPPHKEGPPMHVHFAEDEEGHVRSAPFPW